MMAVVYYIFFFMADCAAAADEISVSQNYGNLWSSFLQDWTDRNS